MRTRSMLAGCLVAVATSVSAMAADIADAPQPLPEQDAHAVFPRQYVHELGRKYYLAPRWVPRRSERQNFDLGVEESAVHDRNHFRLFWTKRPRGHGIVPNRY